MVEIWITWNTLNTINMLKQKIRSQCHKVNLFLPVHVCYAIAACTQERNNRERSNLFLMHMLFIASVTCDDVNVTMPHKVQPVNTP